MWSDGSPFSFFNFRKGGLSGKSGEENCIAMSAPSAWWYDDYCSTLHGSICKKRVMNESSNLPARHRHFPQLAKCTGVREKNGRGTGCPVSSWPETKRRGQRPSLIVKRRGATLPPFLMRESRRLCTACCQKRIATICTSRTSSATFGRLLVSVTRTLYGWPTTASNPVNGVCLTALMLMALQNASTGQKWENA